jgi:hypothetical protein
MGLGTCSPERNITLNNNHLETGSTITPNLSVDEEINICKGKAATSVGKLFKRAWNNPKLTLKTKITIYQACILSSILYGSETWTLYTRQEKRLNSFHLRCLPKIMNIKWQDMVTNMGVLKKPRYHPYFLYSVAED